MTVRLRLAVVALGSALSVACAPSYRWTPHKLDFVQPGRAVVYEALTVYDGDIPGLVAADAQLLGHIKAGSEWVAAKYAAAYGATHVVLVVDASYDQKLWTSCSTGLNTVWCSDTTRHVPVKHHAAIRVPKDRWSSLPEVMHPGHGTTQGLSCRTLPAPPAGCSYSHTDIDGSMRQNQLFLHCESGDEEVKDVSNLVVPNTCPVDEGP